MTRRPYDHKVDDDAAALAPFMTRAKDFLAACRQLGWHIGIAIGRGPVECPTCGTPWPCPPMSGRGEAGRMAGVTGQLEPVRTARPRRRPELRRRRGGRAPDRRRGQAVRGPDLARLDGSAGVVVNIICAMDALKVTDLDRTCQTTPCSCWPATPTARTSASATCVDRAPGRRARRGLRHGTGVPCTRPRKPGYLEAQPVDKHPSEPRVWLLRGRGADARPGSRRGDVRKRSPRQRAT